MRLIRESTYRELMTAKAHLHRELNANRWLAEFDWLLEPLWDYLVGKYEIADARELMRLRLKQRDEATP